MAKKFLVFQHSPWEGPGKILRTAARENNVELDIVRVWQEVIPALEPYDSLVVLGGGPNIDQEKEFPFLIEEKKAIRKSLADNRPYLGFCLGHQLLAEALGAKVGRNHKSSIGFITGYLTHSGQNHPAFTGLPDCFPLFKWHAQTVREPIPGHLKILATSLDCQVEAFSVIDRPHFLGLQFDNHSATSQEIESWLESDEKWLASLQDQAIDRKKILRQAEQYRSRINCEFKMLFANYLKMIDNI